MAGKNKDDWSDSDEDHPPPKQKGPATINNTASNTNKKGLLQLEFQSVKEIRQAIGKSESLTDSSQELLDSIAQLISRYDSYSY
jgi:hypothetical protein